MMLAQGFELGARIIFKRELFHFAAAGRGVVRHCVICLAWCEANKSLSAGLSVPGKPGDFSWV